MQVHRIAFPMLLAFCLIVIHSHLFVQAAETEAIPIQKMRLVVLAPDGSPVVGAKVKPDGLRTIIDPGSHYWWVTKRHGPHPEQLTDKNGAVEITYPKYVDERKETGKVTVTIDHPDYVLYWADQSTSQNLHEVTLKKGYQLRVFAVTKHHGLKKITSRLYGLIHDRSTRSQFEWTREKQGTLISPAFERKKTIGWAVQLTEKPILFSDTFEIDPTQSKDTVNQTRRTLLLKPGYRVEGQIDEAVPRPIKNGRVLIYVTPVNRPEGWANMMWQDVAQIKPDGTFLFESLPRCEVAQVLTLCDGWISSQPQAVDFHELRQPKGKVAQPWQLSSGTYAQVHRIDTQKPFLNVKMEKTVSVDFNILKPDQTPLAGATVAMWPNLRIEGLGAVIIGTVFPTREVLTLKDTTVYYDKKLLENKRFSATTDARGKAVIKNLPARTSIGWTVQHDDFDMPALGIVRERRSRNLDATQSPIPLQTIVMEKKGTHLLGETKAESKPKKKRKRGSGKVSTKQE